jgi:hypothetical protein
MADDLKSEQAKNRKGADAPLGDLPPQEVSKDAEQVKGGKSPKTNWDIPGSPAEPSA